MINYTDFTSSTLRRIEENLPEIKLIKRLYFSISCGIAHGRSNAIYFKVDPDQIFFDYKDAIDFLETRSGSEFAEESVDFIINKINEYKDKYQLIIFLKLN